MENDAIENSPTSGREEVDADVRKVFTPLDKKIDSESSS